MKSKAYYNLNLIVMQTIIVLKSERVNVKYGQQSEQSPGTEYQKFSNP